MSSSRRRRAEPEDTGEPQENGEAPPRDIRDDEPEEAEILTNLRGLNVGELRRVVAFAQARIREREADEKAALKARLLKEVQDSGFSFDDLFGTAGKSAKHGGKLKGDEPKAERAPVPVKYRGPNPGDTWSGRGREPGWLKALVAEGHSKEDYRVEQAAA